MQYCNIRNMQYSIEIRGNLCTELGPPVENRENSYWQRAASRRRKNRVPPPPPHPRVFVTNPECERSREFTLLREGTFIIGGGGGVGRGLGGEGQQ